MTKLRFFLVVPLTTAMLLVACGSDDSAATDGTYGSAVNTTVAQADGVADASATTAVDADALTDGPQSPGEHGPLSASDTNRDGSVTRAEIEAFMDAGPERRAGPPLRSSTRTTRTATTLSIRTRSKPNTTRGSWKEDESAQSALEYLDDTWLD